MKDFLAGVILELIVLIAIATAVYFHNPERFAPKEVTVTQVSGEKISHDKFDYSSGAVKFHTHAEGKGEIITEIPKVNIPEARAWMQDNNGIMLELLLTDDDRIYGISYLRRWNNISAGGGVLVSGKRFEGVKVQTEYWFSL